MTAGTQHQSKVLLRHVRFQDLSVVKLAGTCVPVFSSSDSFSVISGLIHRIAKCQRGSFRGHSLFIIKIVMSIPASPRTDVKELRRVCTAHPIHGISLPVSGIIARI